MVWEEGVLPERSERFSASENMEHVRYLRDYYREAYIPAQMRPLVHLLRRCLNRFKRQFKRFASILVLYFNTSALCLNGARSV